MPGDHCLSTFDITVFYEQQQQYHNEQQSPLCLTYIRIKITLKTITKNEFNYNNFQNIFNKF